MLTVRIADFTADHAEIRGIRFAVFVDEQRVPESIEIDARDPHCIHLLACDDANQYDVWQCHHSLVSFEQRRTHYHLFDAFTVVH